MDLYVFSNDLFDAPTFALCFIRIGPQVLAFYRNLLNLRLLFKNQKKLKLSSVFKWLDISELKMLKLIDLCDTLENLRAPAPLFILMAGDANFDYRNFHLAG